MKKIYLKFLVLTLVLFVIKNNTSIAQEIHASNKTQSSCDCAEPSRVSGSNDTQYIQLQEGWNFISFDVSPANKNIESVFNSLDPGNLIFVTSFDNGMKTYDPNLPNAFNTLQEIADGFGYWVKVNSCHLLQISGLPIDDDFQKPLVNGWNIVAYPPDTPQSPETYFQNLIPISNNQVLINTLEFVTGFSCYKGTLYYDPYGPPFLNSLQEMRNGKGYWVKVYTINSSDKTKLSNSTNVFSFISGTSNLPAGEQIKVLNEAGETIARLDVVEDNYLVTSTIYGDDKTTEAKENISIGENYRFSWNNQILDVATTFKGDFEIEKVNLKFDLANIVAVKAYPVPAKDVLNFEIRLEEKTDLLLQIYDTKGRLVQSINNTSLSAGIQVINSNIETLAEGIYTYKLIANNQLNAGKFNVVR